MRKFSMCVAILLCTANGVAAADDNEFKDWPESHFAGSVADAEGKPIANAKVHLNNLSGPLASPKGNTCFTGPDGKFSLAVRTKPGSQAMIDEVLVSARGFVQLRERFLSGDAVLSPGESTDFRFVLARGEVLAGKVDLPLLGQALLLATESGPASKPTDRSQIISVRGPSYKEHFSTEKDGSFEVFVPRGSYTVSLYQGPGARYPARLESVGSGSTRLTLRPSYPRPSEKELAAAFDALWDDMNRNYSYFSLKKVDWNAAKTRSRPAAIAARDLAEFVAELETMLASLHDGHVWIDFGERLPTRLNRTDANYNGRVVMEALSKPVFCKDFAVVGTTRADGFGAFVMNRQGSADRDAVQQAVQFIRSHRDVPGFLVDLRESAGGDERLALRIASEFCGKDVVYAKSRYRSGPAHDDFGPVYDREMKATKDAYTRPVVCLIGPRAVSSGEAFVQMMKCLPHVTTVGSRTRGSSGNPKPFELPGLNVSVWYSRWLDMMPDGSVIEDKGIAPDVVVDVPASAYRDKDSTWEKAIEFVAEQSALSHGRVSVVAQTTLAQLLSSGEWRHGFRFVPP